MIVAPESVDDVHWASLADEVRDEVLRSHESLAPSDEVFVSLSSTGRVQHLVEKWFKVESEYLSKQKLISAVRPDKS